MVTIAICKDHFQIWADKFGHTLKINLNTVISTLSVRFLHIVWITQFNRYYNAWLETYTEEEYKRHTDSGTFLDGEKDLESIESESENEQLEDLSMEFQNESFSDDSSEFELSDVESDLFHSAEDDMNGREDDDSFITFESPSVHISKESSSKTATASSLLDDNEEESVFMHDFSDTSNDEEDGGNFLGKLETQVMNLSLSRFRK